MVCCLLFDVAPLINYCIELVEQCQTTTIKRQTLFRPGIRKALFEKQLNRRT